MAGLGKKARKAKQNAFIVDKVYNGYIVKSKWARRMNLISLPLFGLNRRSSVLAKF
jgi:hypothetical protein